MNSIQDEALLTDPIFIIEGPAGKEEKFIGIMTILGRSPDCDICINAAGVAELHAVACRSAAGLIIRDLFSGNGINVNGERVSEALLNDGDEILLGRVKLTLRIPTSSEGTSDVQAQQDLIQQMARRISQIETKRRRMASRAWRFRKQFLALPGASSLSSNSEEASLRSAAISAAANSRIKELESTLAARTAELERERSQVKQTAFGMDASETTKLRAEVAAERRRTEAMEARGEEEVRQLTAECNALKQRLDLQQGGASSDDLLALHRENERLQRELSDLTHAVGEIQNLGGLQEYEKQLNTFRDQLGTDADGIQQREFEVTQREREVQIAEEQVQGKITETEKELSSERARIKREQSQIERMLADARIELEDMKREAETLERDERFQRLRTSLRSDAKDAKDAEPTKLSDKIQRFLKGFGR